MNWNLLNLFMFAGYMALLLLIGVIIERRMSGTATGFLLAERSATLPWIIMSIFATGVGSLAYIATVGMINKGGVIDLWFEFFWVIGIPLLVLLFARKLRMSGIISFWDTFSFRFGSKVALIVALFTMFIIPFDFAQMVKGGGLTFSDMFPALGEVPSIDPVFWGALLVVVVIGIYLACGGFKSCLITDMMQGILTWLAMIVPTIAIFLLMGNGSLTAGWQHIVSFFTENSMGNFLQFKTVVGPTAPCSTYNYSYISSMLIMQVLLIMLPSMFYGSRYMAAKNERIARQGPVLALILTFIPYGLFINVTALSFTAYAPDIAGDELFTGVLSKLASTNAIPMVLSSLLLISLLAAVMGTLDSRFMQRMSDYSRTVYHLWINPKATDKQLIRAGRRILMLLMAVAMISAFFMPDSIWFLNIAVSAIQGPLLFILVLGAFWSKRATWKGALAGGLISSGIALLFTVLLTGFEGQYPWLICQPLANVWPGWLKHQFITYPIGIAIFFLVNKTTPPQRPEHLERFFSATETERYVKKYGFDKSYVVLEKASRLQYGNELTEAAKAFEMRNYGKETRVYGADGKLRTFAEQFNLRYYLPYERYESWKEVFDSRLKGVYRYGLDIAKQRETEHIGEHERKSAKVIGSVGISISIILFFLMFWHFPLQWKTSMVFYAVGSGLMFAAVCVFFEDYKWASRLVDILSSPFTNKNPK